MIISCGKCDKNFWYYVLAYFIISILNIGCHPTFPKINIEQRTKEFILLKPTLIYLGELLMFFYELIYNKIHRSEQQALLNKKEKNKLSKKDYIYFGIICFLLLLSDFYRIMTLLYFKKYSFLNYVTLNKSWTFVLIFLIIFSIYHLKINVYRHQKLAIIFYILSGVTSLLIGTIINLEDEFVISDFGLIIFQFLFSIIEAIIIILIKKIMDKNYFSPLKVCYLIGFFNFIISSISLFILSNIKKNSEYIFSFSSIRKDEIFKAIIFFTFFPLMNGISKLLINVILNKYTMFHLFIFFKFDALIDSSIIAYQKKEKKKIYSAIDLSLHLLECFMHFVYLEMVELNFCGLSQNIKRKIKDRASKEYNEIDEEQKNLDVNFDLDGGYTSNFNETDLELKKMELNSEN